MTMTLMDYINGDIEAELHEYSKHERHINDVDGFYEGMLAGRYEFAQELWELINNWEIKEAKRKKALEIIRSRKEENNDKRK